MAISQARIVAIEDVSHGKNYKNLITIKDANDGLAFIEFRGMMKDISDSFKPNDLVSIEFLLQGSVSKRGFRHNNLIGIDIKPAVYEDQD